MGKHQDYTGIIDDRREGWKYVPRGPKGKKHRGRAWTPFIQTNVENLENHLRAFYQEAEATRNNLAFRCPSASLEISADMQTLREFIETGQAREGQIGK